MYDTVAIIMEILIDNNNNINNNKQIVNKESKVCVRSEEHTSELQSRQYLVCRLLLEKKKKTNTKHSMTFT